MNREFIAKELLAIARELTGADTPPFIRRLERMTANNSHPEAVLYLAKSLSNSVYVKEAKVIMQEHKRLGHLSPELMNRRDILMRKLWSQATKKWGPEIGQMVYQAF